jgi:HAE1 family hydrophobic/amphiphilic exporter-1
MSFQEKKVGSEAVMVFALAIVLVFLVLAAQYESWTSPAAVILVVPLAVLGTVTALVLRGFDNNVYTQIGIVLLIGLASKNAILIVEFAREQRDQGKGILDAAIAASQLRFRPILMTAISSIAGFMPLVVASGAGAASRQAIGTAVVGGMIAATIMSLIFTPVFYVVMQGLSELGRKKSGCLSRRFRRSPPNSQLPHPVACRSGGERKEPVWLILADPNTTTRKNPDRFDRLGQVRGDLTTQAKKVI